jgi:DNA-directed RNA polymerase beta subunit
MHEESEMPVAEDGVPIDLICNCHSFPKRMTVAYQVEHFVSMLGILNFKAEDGTGFVDVEQLVKRTQDQMH